MTATNETRMLTNERAYELIADTLWHNPHTGHFVAYEMLVGETECKFESEDNFTKNHTYHAEIVQNTVGIYVDGVVKYVACDGDVDELWLERTWFN